MMTFLACNTRIWSLELSVNTLKAENAQLCNETAKRFDPSKIPSSSDTGITGQVLQQTLLSKYRHYEKLIKIYEKNLSVMQVRITVFQSLVLVNRGAFVE